MNRDSGKILAVSRKDDHSAFGLPGGKVEDSETLEEAAKRELLEETGIIAHTLEDSFTHICHGEQTFDVTTFLVSSYSISDSGINELGVVSWVEPKVLIDGPFGDYNKRLFEQLDINFS